MAFSFSFVQLVVKQLDGVVAVVEEQLPRMGMLKDHPLQRKAVDEQQKKLRQ